MIDSSNFEAIRELVEKAELKDALIKTKELILELGNTELVDTISILITRFNNHIKKIHNGVISLDEENREINKISESVLDLLSDLERKGNARHEEKTNMPQSSKTELIEASKTAIILIELEKIKYKYYQSDLRARNEVLDELRVYKHISNDSITLEIYNFLFELADSVSYRTPDDFGIEIFTLIMHFYPNETNELEAILKLSIKIGNRLVRSGIFKQEHFKIGSYGLAIWKWVYLRAKESNQEEIKRKVRAEFKEIKNIFFDQDLKISNQKEKLQLIEICEEDLKKHGLDFPVIPNELSFLI